MINIKVIAIPDEGLKWAVNSVLIDLMGLNAKIEFITPVNKQNFQPNNIILESAGKCITLPNIIFGLNNDQKKAAYDKLSNSLLQHWDNITDQLSSKKLPRSIPVIMGKAGFRIKDENNAFINLDIFGSAFFMLSRVEEHNSLEYDTHGRFPAKASLAYRNNFLLRPIIDEYTEVLWQILKRMLPSISRKRRQFEKHISCDVDVPYSPYTQKASKACKKAFGDIIKRKNIFMAANSIGNYFCSQIGIYDFDPVNTFNWIMDNNEAANNSVLFYFLVSITGSNFVDTYSLEEVRIKNLMKDIHNRGHLIGLHGSYSASEDQNLLNLEYEKLATIMSQLDIKQDLTESRQHYLRWKPDKTPAIMDSSGVLFDSTLGYADHIGFRCGTCHEFSMFDLEKYKPMKIKQRPLIIMEGSIISNEYMGFGYSDKTINSMIKLKDECKKFAGQFTLLWHNSEFINPLSKDYYLELIA